MNTDHPTLATLPTADFTTTPPTFRVPAPRPFTYPTLTARQREQILCSGGTCPDPKAWGSIDVIARWQSGRHFIEVVIGDFTSRPRYRVEESIADRTGGVAYEQCVEYDLTLSDAIKRAARHALRTILADDHG